MVQSVRKLCAHSIAQAQGGEMSEAGGWRTMDLSFRRVWHEPHADPSRHAYRRESSGGSLCPTHKRNPQVQNVHGCDTARWVYLIRTQLQWPTQRHTTSRCRFRAEVPLLHGQCTFTHSGLALCRNPSHSMSSCADEVTNPDPQLSSSCSRISERKGYGAVGSLRVWGAWRGSVDMESGGDGEEVTEVAMALDGVEGGGKSVLEDDAWVPADFAHEPPVLKVTQPKGSFCQIDARFSVALPPDGVYDIITDPNNRRVFKNIKVSASITLAFHSPYRARIVRRSIRLHFGHGVDGKFPSGYGRRSSFEKCWRMMATDSSWKWSSSVGGASSCCPARSRHAWLWSRTGRRSW